MHRDMEGNQLKYSLNPWKLWVAGETTDMAVNAAGHAQCLPAQLP